MEQNYSKVFQTLNAIDCSGHTETKQLKDKTTGRVISSLTYLSWAWAWTEVKKAFPNSTFTIYENAQGWNYHTDGRTAWVKTGVTIEGVEMIEYLPIMDSRNKSIPVGEITSFDVNKSIQRSLTKAAARHGLGLYIYAGEDLPEDSDAQPAPAKPAAQKKAPAATPAPAPAPVPEATTPEMKELATAKTKAELRAMLTDNHWVANPKLVNYATLLAANLPE